eukprot:623659_1
MGCNTSASAVERNQANMDTKKEIKDIKEYTMTEIKNHNSRDSAWIVIHGFVYDTTTYLDQHPGGALQILMSAGQDGSSEFEGVPHPPSASEKMKEFRIGKLKSES